MSKISANSELSSGATSSLADVIGGGYCIGCGNCAAASLGAIRMILDKEGFVQAVGPEDVVEDPLAALDTSCPFSDNAPNEDMLVAEQPWSGLPYDSQIGHWAGLYAGHVADEKIRFEGGSGGVTSWFLAQLLNRGEVDHVIHVKPVDPQEDPEGRHFRFTVSSSADALMQGRKSRYYPVDLASMYEHILSHPGRYAIVAIPCFAKAIRQMQRRDPILRERIQMVVGLVCGHLKSRSFAEYLGWLQGVPPQSLKAIDFRVKVPGGDASQYTVRASDGVVSNRGVPLKNYFGVTWDLGFMKYRACEFCDDVMAETADIVLGDAWISPFQDDWRGSNIVQTRHPLAQSIVAQGIAEGELALTPIDVDQVIASQRSGLRHRREGLAYRLSLLDRAGIWRPKKRFEKIERPIPADRQSIYLQRMRLARVTAERFIMHRRAHSVARFQISVTGPVFRYYRTAFGFKRALTQSFPVKWLKRQLVKGS